MRVCVVAEYYPRRRDPVLGVWAHRQALAARAAGADVRVVVLERPVPPVALAAGALRGRPLPLLRSLGAFAAQPGRDTPDGLEVEYVRFLAPPRERSYASWHRYARRPLDRALARLHRTWPFDLIHAHYALPAGAAARPFAARHCLPLVISVHGGDVLGPALATPAARAQVASVLGSAASVLCNSAGTRERVAALTGGTAGLSVVHLGADPPRAPVATRAEPTLVTLGHVVARKRHLDVLAALARLHDRVPEARWLVIGDGLALPALRHRVEELGLGERVELAGQLAPEHAREELARGHVMVLPSVDEAFGVAYAEAFAAGLPAVGCRGESGPEELAALGEGMVLVPPRDPVALADALVRLLVDPRRRRALGDAARRTWERHLTWSRCGEGTVAAYRAVLGDRVA